MISWINPAKILIILQNPPRVTFFGKIQHCWKLVLSPLQMGQHTWQEVQAISAEYERSTKMHGAF